MDTDKLLRELARREVVSRSVLKKLEARLADKSDVPSPRAVAKFLVDQGHLTAAQARRALKAILTPEESAILESQRLDADDAPAPDEPSGLSSMYDAAADGAETLAVGDLADVAAPATRGGKRGRPKHKKGKKAKGQSDWDSPLFLIGGGGLFLLLLIGGAILYLLGSETAEERFNNAQQAYDDGSYPQAIMEFEEYLEKHPAGDQASLARVRLGTARIRMATDVRNDYVAALADAVNEADVIEDERAYQDGQAELATLLPEIAEQLAAKADAATDVEAIRLYAEKTEQALALCQNTKLVPANLRDQGQLDEVRAVLDRVRLRQAALVHLREATDAMAAASAAGDPKAAYETHTAFAKNHPELAQDPGLIAAVTTAAAAEEALVTFVADARPGVREPAESPVIAELAVAVPRVDAPAPAEGVAVLRLAGGLYGLSAQDGRLLWRRYVGAMRHDAPPLRIDADLVVVDARRKELVRLRADDGQLVWRAPLDGELAQPALLGDRLLCPASSGRLYVVDAGTGDSPGYVRFAQPLLVAPTVGADGAAVYLTGEHSSVYSLAGDDLACLSVFYLGHAKGAVSVPPVAVLNRVLVFENDGAETSSLHVLGVAENGAVDRQLTSQRMQGLVTDAPDAFARRLAVTTDTGHVDVFEVSADADAQPLVQLASREPTRARRGPRHAAVVDGELWLAEEGLFRYSISPTGNRLPVRDVEEPFRRDSFIHPLEVVGGVLIHARKRPGKPGVSVGATDLRTGEAYWQTDLAAPPAGAPVSNAGATKLLLGTAAGHAFRVDGPPARYAVAAKPLTPRGEQLVFDATGTLDDGSAVYWDTALGRAAHLGGADAPSFELPGALACAPAPLGRGWVVPLVMGQVHVVSGETGRPLAAPYQPALRPREAKRWRTPAVDGRRVIIADDDSVVLLELQGRDPSRLAEIARVDAAGPDAVQSRIVVAGRSAFFAQAGGRVAAISTGTLEPAGTAQLTGEVLWGPYAIGDRVLVATSDGELVCLAADRPEEPAWRSPIDAADLVGAPLPVEGGPVEDGPVEGGPADVAVVLALGAGLLQRFDLQSGAPQAALDVGQRVAGGPSGYGPDVAIGTPDGALLIVPQP